MFLAKVIGNKAVATQKSPEFNGMKLLLIQPYINKEKVLVASGSSVVAVDTCSMRSGTAMKKAGAFELMRVAVERLSDAVFKFDGPGKGCGRAHLKRDLVGRMLLI